MRSCMGMLYGGQWHHRGRDLPNEVLQVLFCSECGAWSSAAQQKHRCGLMSSCRGQPTRAGQGVLRRLARGLHPKRGLEPPLATVVACREPAEAK